MIMYMAASPLLCLLAQLIQTLSAGDSGVCLVSLEARNDSAVGTDCQIGVARLALRLRCHMINTHYHVISSSGDVVISLGTRPYIHVDVDERIWRRRG